MIMLLFYWLYVTGVTLSLGIFFEKLLAYFFKLDCASTRIHFAYTTLCGFVFITILATWFSVFYRINIEFNILLLTLCLVVSYLYRHSILSRLQCYYVSLQKTSWIPKIIFGLCIFLASSGSCIDSIWNYDHGMYYVQYVTWIENYAVVPGLGNIIGQLAYNSTWHILTAVFSFSFLGESIKFNDLNGLFWLFMMTRSLFGLENIWKQKARFSDYFTAFMIAPIYVTRYYFNAAYADFTIICLIFLILTLLVEVLESQRWGQVDLSTILIGILSFYAVTVKLSSVPIMLPILALLFFLGSKKRFLEIGKAGIIVLALVVPWLIRYYYLSGFLIFPFHQLDLFDVDWKMSYDMSFYFQTEIEARSKLNKFDYDIREVTTFSYARWLPEWFDLLKNYDKVIIVFFVVVWLVFNVFYGIYFFKNKFKNRFILFWLTVGFGLLFWFSKAPSPRFGYAWMFSALFFVSAFISEYLLKKIPKLKYIYISAVLLLSVKVTYDGVNELYLYAGTEYEYGKTQISWHHQKKAHRKVLEVIFGKTPKTIVPPTVSYKIGDFTFHYPKYRDIYFKNLCLDAPIPCFSYQIDYIELRGKSLQDGFRLK